MFLYLLLLAITLVVHVDQLLQFVCVSSKQYNNF